MYKRNNEARFEDKAAIEKQSIFYILSLCL